MRNDFKRLRPGDKDIVTEYLRAAANISCEYSFANLCAWADVEAITWSESSGVLLIRNRDGHFFPIAACGDRGKAEAAAAALAAGGASFVHLNKEQADFLTGSFPGMFEVSCDRDRSEYIHDAESFRTYAGKKLHAKRNHMNRFEAMYGDICSVERIGPGNLAECAEYSRAWGEVNRYYLNGTLAADLKLVDFFLSHYQELGLFGICLRLSGAVRGFTVAERAYPGSSAAVVHVEKASYEIDGIYPALASMLMREFPEYAAVNREDDLGDEGLRKSKLSYRPLYLLEKYTARNVGGK